MKSSARKKTQKVGESGKLLRRISPKINSPNFFESSSVRNTGTTGRTLSSEFTLTPSDANKALLRLERENSELLALYSKLSDDLIHLKTLEKLDKQREKQINLIKNKINANAKEKSEILNNIKICEQIFKEFSKKMEKGGVTADEKKALAGLIQGFYDHSGLNSIQESETSSKEFKMSDLWDLLPKTEKILNNLMHK